MSGIANTTSTHTQISFVPETGSISDLQTIPPNGTFRMKGLFIAKGNAKLEGAGALSKVRFQTIQVLILITKEVSHGVEY